MGQSMVHKSLERNCYIKQMKGIDTLELQKTGCLCLKTLQLCRSGAHSVTHHIETDQMSDVGKGHLRDNNERS